MTMIASFDLESNTLIRHAVSSPADAWRAAVQAEAASMQANCPDLHERIADATTLVLTNQVELGLDGHASVASRSTAGVRYDVNGTCPCKDAAFNTEYCAHRLAVALVKRATKHLAAPVVMPDAPATTPPAVDALFPAPVHSIAPEHIVEIQGKRFVKFAGLLALAHARGLLSLTADWTFNDGTLSLAHAVAVFPFGRFEECGDASPDNVTKKVAVHFRRVALTRAKARVLRDALNIDMVALEELAEA